MSFDNDALDRDVDDGSAELDAIVDGVLREVEAARAALRTLTPGMDRQERWAILDRFAKAMTAVQVEQDRAHYGAMNARIVAEITA